MRTLPLSLLLSFVPLAAPLAAQDVPGLVAALAKAESLDDDAIGIAGSKSDTYKLYEQLLAKATPEQLLELARHQSPIVRGYAVRGLCTMPARVDLKQLMLDHLRDTAEVATFQGCIQSKEPIGDVMFACVRPHLGKEELLDVAEALVRSGSPLFARQWALRNVSFRDGMLHELRKLAKAGEAAAGIALARFRLQPDVDVLQQLLQQPEPFADNCQYLAASAFPDPQLLPALRALLPAARQRLGGDNAYRLRFWLDAIAAQGSAPAAQLLQDVLEQVPPTDHKRADLARTLLEVLASHPQPQFDGVRAAAAKLRR